MHGPAIEDTITAGLTGDDDNGRDGDGDDGEDDLPSGKDPAVTIDTVTDNNDNEGNSLHLCDHPGKTESGWSSMY
jgi:hypothetical protein